MPGANKKRGYLRLETSDALFKLLKLSSYQVGTKKGNIYDEKRGGWNDMGISKLSRDIGKSDDYIRTHLDILK